MKIMLYDADMRESEFLRLLRQGERVAKVVGAGLLLGSDVGEKLHAELHATLRAPR